MQLVAYGAQDFYLTGNPQITFFKVVYRRHTNFATESIEQTFTGNPNFGSRVVCNLQRSGDLVTKMYFRAELPDFDLTSGGKWAWAPRVGHVLIQDVYMEIGGTQIDKHYNDWLNIWYELARNFAQDRGYAKMIGNTAELTTLATSHSGATVWVPLQFACCRNDGLALPIIALQYHDVKLTFDLQSLDRLVEYTGDSFSLLKSGLSLRECSLYVDYVYLDNEERKRFAQASHEYLFEQLQFTGAETTNGTSNKYRLNLNHPCKELVWVTKLDKWTSGSKFLAYDQDLATMQKLATARFVLRTCTYAGTGELYIDGSGNGMGNLTCDSTYNNTTISEIFTAVNPAAITNVPDVDNITILGRMLTLEEMSHTIEEWKFTTNPAESNGNSNDDVTLNLHNNYGLYIDGSVNPTVTALLQLNGHDRFTEREGDYFNYVQPWQCHTNTPADGVNVYSFALNPEEHQPSGTCNMSRIDNATLNVRFDPAVKNNASFSIFATNYNVLRVMSGMGGLAYSN